MRTALMALIGVLCLSGCAGSPAEQEYLQMLETSAGWVTDSEFERQEALSFGYKVCDLMRDGADPVQEINYGPTKGYAAVYAGVYLCPELSNY